MAFRGPKSVKLYHNGELCAEMESVKATVDLLVLYDPRQRSWKTVQKMFWEARKNNTELFGFTFVEDPNWISSRAVVATDVETNETFVKDSVREMGLVVCGPNDIWASRKISKLCKNGGTYRGLTFRYVNENDGYPTGCYGGAFCSRRPIQQLDIVTGAIIHEFPSITRAAYYIWEAGISGSTSVPNISATLSDCVNGAPKYNGIYLGYKWQFTP